MRERIEEEKKKRHNGNSIVDSNCVWCSLDSVPHAKWATDIFQHLIYMYYPIILFLFFLVFGIKNPRFIYSLGGHVWKVNFSENGQFSIKIVNMLKRMKLGLAME